MNNERKRRDFRGLAAGTLIAAAARPKGAAAQTGSSRPIRLGFVGVGDRGSYHLDIALGIEGVETMYKGKERDGKLAFGALGIGGLKLKLHRGCIGQLFESADQVLDAEEIYALAKEMA